MRVLLVGDSHLARVRRASLLVGPDVRNLAEGGSTVLDLPRQLNLADSSVALDDLQPPVVLSVGTNDAAERRGVTREQFATGLDEALGRLRGRPVAFLAPPGVIESRRAGQYWSNQRVDAYRDRAMAVAREHSVAVIRADRILAPLGARAYGVDGLHLNGLGYRNLLPRLDLRAWA